MDTPLQWFDMTVLAIMLVSGLFAFLNGFFKEVLSLLVWGGAFAIAIFGYAPVMDYILLDMGKEVPEWLLKPLTIGGLFFISLIALGIVGSLFYKIGTMVLVGKGSESKSFFLHFVIHGLFNRSLGFLFGILRGFIFVCLLWILFDMMLARETPPDWFEEAKTGPVIVEGSRVIKQGAQYVVARFHLWESEQEIEPFDTSQHEEFLEGMILPPPVN